MTDVPVHIKLERGDYQSSRNMFVFEISDKQAKVSSNVYLQSPISGNNIHFVHTSTDVDGDGDVAGWRYASRELYDNNGAWLKTVHDTYKLLIIND